MSKLIVLGAAAILLSLQGCTNARDPGYICMTNCAHECADGMSGDSCRAMKQQQDKDHDDDEHHYHDND